MNVIIEYLSGEVPGGILLLLLILFIINLLFYFFYKGSKFYTKEQYRSKVIKSSFLLLSSYILLWFLLKPAPIPESILFVPFQNNQMSDYRISEILERDLDRKISDKYRIHNWEWFYKSCILDSIDNFEYRNSVAKRMKIKFIISGEYISDSKIKVFIENQNNYINQTFEFISYDQLSNKIIEWIDDNYQILDEKYHIASELNDQDLLLICKSKIFYLNSDYSNALNIANIIDPLPVILKSKILLELGKIELSKTKKSDFEQLNIKYFNEIVKLLIPIAQEGNDSAIINRILGELYLFEEKYQKAEIFLKKALTQNPNNARIYYDLYFLHKDRFKDLGFDDRFEVLEKAIDLDPGYIDANYELANEYFQTGTGSKSGTGTTLALETLNRFMQINNSNKKILNLLASINLQIKHTEEAIVIYKYLIEQGYNESETFYNLGIAYFHLKKYEKAKTAFLKSINLNEYPDSFLYMGAIYKILGDYDKALYYYRERIKRRKKREDDYYATEALHGLQWILKKQYEDSIKKSQTQ